MIHLDLQLIRVLVTEASSGMVSVEGKLGGQAEVCQTTEEWTGMSGSRSDDTSDESK